MTVINHETGEIVDLNPELAERRAQQIEARLGAIGESFASALQKIREAIEQRDDQALGYRSPGEYVSARFGKALSGLPFEMRREAVRELTQAGMSSRALAPVFDVSDRMIRKDKAAGGNRVPTSTPQTPASAPEGEADVDAGQTPQGEATNERQAADARDTAPPAPRPPVVGIDGKTYPQSAVEKKRQEASQPRRRPLPDAFWQTAYDLGKKAESLHRLTQDDRWAQNAEKVAASHRNDLLRINDLLSQVISSFPEKEASS